MTPSTPPITPPIVLRPVSLDRMMRAVERVRERLLRAVGALEAAGVAYSVVEGNAVAAWVSRIDEAAVRNTQDVDLLLRREDLEAAKAAGFHYRHVKSIDLFLDGAEAKARDAVHVVFAGERVRPDYATISPSVEDHDATGEFRVVNLEPLVRMKLTSYRLKDRVHLRDMADVGLLDESWLARFDGPLAERLREVLDNPEA
jgi:hypothetical protein